jgi:hypothetical protein
MEAKMNFSLTNHIQENALIALYTDIQNTDKFLVGAVFEHSDDYLLLSLLSANACFDGICLCAVSSVFRIEIASQYICSLIAGTEVILPVAPVEATWCSFWEFAKKRNQTVTLKLCSNNKTISGIPVQHSDTAIVLRRVSPYRAINRCCTISRNNVAYAVCGSLAEIK